MLECVGSVIVVLVAIFPQYMTQKADEAEAEQAEKAAAQDAEEVELNKVGSASEVIDEPAPEYETKPVWEAETEPEPAAEGGAEPEPDVDAHVE